MTGRGFGERTASARLGVAWFGRALRLTFTGRRFGALRLGAQSVVMALVIAACAVLVGVESDFVGRIPPLSGVDALFYDASVAVIAAWSRDPWPTTAVVLIDQDTLSSPGWSSVPRALQQPQLGRLGRDLLDLGARRVGYDLVFAFDPADLPSPWSAPAGYDAPLTDLLAARGEDVVLGADASVAPAERYADIVGTAHLGIIDLQTEGDGRVRSIANRVRLREGQRRFGLAAALARDPDATDVLAGRTFLLPKAALGSIPHLSARDIEACLASQEGRADLARLLRGRTIVIGSGLEGEDEHEGPDRFLPRPNTIRTVGSACRGRVDAATSRKAGRVPGAFLQAAAVEALQSRAPIVLASSPVRVAGNLAVAALGLCLMLFVGRAARLPPVRSRLLGTTLRSAAVLGASLVLLVLLSVAVDALGLAIWRLWIPIGVTVAAMVAFCVVATMALAVKRDLALADLKLAFGRWLPPHVIDATLDARHTVLHGSERVITVLMADLNDFTPFCAAHRDRPESIVLALNAKFSLAQAAIDQHGGCLDKFDGDAVIAFWNGIEPQPDHAMRAVAAAVDLIRADRGDTGSALTFKCAIATGVAFVGRYGSNQKSNFSALGEPMNLAARLEKLCRPHGLDIVIAGSTADAMKSATPGSNLSDCTVLVGQAKLKGFDVPVQFYTVSTQ